MKSIRILFGAGSLFFAMYAFAADQDLNLSPNPDPGIHIDHGPNVRDPGIKVHPPEDLDPGIMIGPDRPDRDLGNVGPDDEAQNDRKGS